MQLKMLNIFTQEFRVLTGNFEFQISADKKQENCNTLMAGDGQ